MDYCTAFPLVSFGEKKRGRLHSQKIFFNENTGYLPPNAPLD